ncbi:hypothetical protein BGZ76_006479, partial [Entomortierella beljakovae]
MFKDKYGETPLSEKIIKQNHFRVALSDTGYIPRSYSQAISTIVGQLEEEDLRTIISLGLTNTPITRVSQLPSGKTVGEIETTGMIFLASANQLNTDYLVVSMPFVQLKMLNRKFTEPIIPDDRLIIPTKDKPWDWSDFEKLLGYYHRVLVGAIINTDKEVMQQKVEIHKIKAEKGRLTGVGSEIVQSNINRNLENQQLHLADVKSMLYRPLCQVFRGAVGHRSLLSCQVKLEEFEVFEEAAQCLHEETDTIPLSDVIICKDDQGVEKAFGREKGIFHCMGGTANIDYRW